MGKKKSEHRKDKEKTGKTACVQKPGDLRKHGTLEPFKMNFLGGGWNVFIYIMCFSKSGRKDVILFNPFFM